MARNLTAVGGATIDRDQLIDRVTGALKLDDAAAGEATAGRVLTVITARADAELDGA